MTALPDRSLAARLAEAVKGQYTIEGEIGRGGMGVVYRARDERLQRRVAIKVLPPELAYQDDIRQRFTREAQMAAKLAHPNIVPIHDVGDEDGLVYFVMMYVDGESVGARLKRRGKLPFDEARRIMRDTADALSVAHTLGIVHRDIKPDNILLEGARGRVMVTDFGIAKALSQSSGATLTGAGMAIGTPQFMSPEQAAGEREIDGRSDLYSLGVVAYQMITGSLPFDAPTVAAVLVKQITEPAPDIRIKRPDCPTDLALAVMRCLEKDPANRWATAEALVRALDQRSVPNYQPTGTGYGAAARPTAQRPGQRPTLRPMSTPSLPERPSLQGRPPLSDRLQGGTGALRDRVRANQLAARDLVRSERGRNQGLLDANKDGIPRLDNGEPRIVQQVRGQFATWAAVNLGLFLINVATTGGTLSPPWFLFPAAGMGIGLLRNYAKLWQSGYSWRDVLARPAAADSVERKRVGGAVQEVTAPVAEELGAQFQPLQHVWGDRQAILRIADKLTPEEKKMLPELSESVEALYRRALDLARTLHLMSADIEDGGLQRIDAKLSALGDATTSEQQRQKSLLEQQRRTTSSLIERRKTVEGQLESCILAMQNMRLDMLKLKSSNLREVLGDLTQATAQVKALSRNVDNAIAAASEVREAIR